MKRTDENGGAPEQARKLANRMCKAGALAAILGGSLRIVAAFVPYVPQSAVLESLYATIDLSFLFGLSAIFWRHAGRFGSLAAGGYLFATAGIASIVGPDPRMFGLEFYLVGSAVVELGLLTLAIAMIRQHVVPGAAWCWIISAGASISVPFGGAELAYVIAGCALGFGFAWAGARTYHDMANQRELTTIAQSEGGIT